MTRRKWRTVRSNGWPSCASSAHLLVERVVITTCDNHGQARGAEEEAAARDGRSA